MKAGLLLAIIALFFITNELSDYSGSGNLFSAIEILFIRSDTQWLFVVCIVVYCLCFMFLSFSPTDILLIGVLLTGGFVYIVNYPTTFQTAGVLAFLGSITLGRGSKCLLMPRVGSKQLNGGEDNMAEISNSESGIQGFLIGLVLLLGCASFWHLDMTNNFYHGPRWMGLWNNPNDYGMLMGAGLTLAIGLLAGNVEGRMKNEEAGGRKSDGSWNLLRFLRSLAAKKVFAVLFFAAGMMGVGLLFSYSRGAWVGAAVGLLYLAKAYGKFKWRWVLPPALVALVVICFFWNNTSDSAPWYLKRLDLSRASAQHRIAAWKAGFEIMRDHPFGVGWNKAVETYAKNYSPPEDGAPAITTNDYLMLGTQLGIPGLLCFLAYVALCFRGRARHSVRAGLCGQSPGGGQRTASPTLDSGLWTQDSRLRAACRAGTLVFLVAFWFDAGLFKLATASVFWVLLELGSERQKLKTETLKAEMEKQEMFATKEHKEHKENSDSSFRSFLRSLRFFAAIKPAIGNRKFAIDRSLMTSAATK